MGKTYKTKAQNVHQNAKNRAKEKQNRESRASKSQSGMKHGTFKGLDSGK